MKKRSILFFLVLTTMLVCLPFSARASMVTYNLSASGFTPLYGGSAPIDPLTGVLTINYTGTDITGVSLTLNNLAIATTSTLAFTQTYYEYWFGKYSAVGIGYIVGDGDTIDGINSGTNDISLSFQITDSNIANSSDYNSFFMAYANGTGGYWTTTTASLTPVTPTPIPAAAWLLGSGLLGLFGVRRRLIK